MTNFDLESKDFTGYLPITLQNLANSEHEILLTVSFFAANRMEKIVDDICNEVHQRVEFSRMEDILKVIRDICNSHSKNASLLISEMEEFFALSELRTSESCYLKGFCDAVDTFSANPSLFTERKTKREPVLAETSSNNTQANLVHTQAILAHSPTNGGDFYG